MLVEDKHLANYFEGAVSEALNWAQQDLSGKEFTQAEDKLKTLATNYMIKNLRTLVSGGATSIKNIKITHENFGELIYLIQKGEVSSAAARDVLEEMFNTGKDPSNIIEEGGLKQVSNEEELETIVNDVISVNQNAVGDYRKGKDEAMEFLVGQVMLKSRGTANPQVAAKLLKNKLK